MKKDKKTSPRLTDSTAEFFTGTFSSLNAGAEYVLQGFPALYKHTLRELKGKFTDGELKLMIDVFNSTALTPIMAGQQLDLQVLDGMELDGLDQKWEVDKAELMAKVNALTIFQAACLEIWANGFWCAEKSDVEKPGSIGKHVEGLL